MAGVAGLGEHLGGTVRLVRSADPAASSSRAGGSRCKRSSLRSKRSRQHEGRKLTCHSDREEGASRCDRRAGREDGRSRRHGGGRRPRRQPTSGSTPRPSTRTRADQSKQVNRNASAFRTARRGEQLFWWGFGIVGVIIWIAIAFWPATGSGSEGSQLHRLLLLSLLFFPLSLIMAYMVEDRTVALTTLDSRPSRRSIHTFRTFTDEGASMASPSTYDTDDEPRPRLEGVRRLHAHRLRFHQHHPRARRDHERVVLQEPRGRSQRPTSGHQHDLDLGMDIFIWGLIVVCAGFGAFTGHMWARIVGIAAALLNMLLQFGFMAAFPFLAFTIILIDIFVIWGLAVHGQRVSRGLCNEYTAGRRNARRRTRAKGVEMPVDRVRARPSVPGRDRAHRGRVEPGVAACRSGHRRVRRTCCSSCSTTRVSGSSAVSAARSRRRISTRSRRTACATTTCTRRRCARRAGRASSPAATITATTWRASPSSPPAFRATTATCRSRTASCPRCCSRRATTPTWSASGT